MKKRTVGTGLIGLLLAGLHTAHATTIDLNSWTIEVSPGYAKTGQTWSFPTTTSALSVQNGYGSLISNFTNTGDFTFSGTLSPTTEVGDDNDALGIIFGWQDAANHYRLGWEQGGLNDISGASGIFLIEEKNGISSILWQNEIFWTDDVTYSFSAGRAGDLISFALGGETLTINNTTFMSGHIGFYTESQTAEFSGLNSVPEPPSSVPEPATMLLFGMGVAGLVRAGRKQRSKE